MSRLSNFTHFTSYTGVYLAERVEVHLPAHQLYAHTKCLLKLIELTVAANMLGLCCLGEQNATDFQRAGPVNLRG
jgi:hypothetical protein